MADYETSYISSLPTGVAAGGNFLVQDDGAIVTKVPLNEAVAAAAILNLFIRRMGILPTNANVDDLFDQGVYSLVQANTYSGLPSGVTIGMLLVLKPQETNNTYTTQLIVSYTGNVYVRIRQASAWSAWNKLATA